MSDRGKIKITNLVLEKNTPLTSEDKAKFAYFGEKATIEPPYRILNPQHVIIGDGVTIRENGQINAFTDLSFLLMHVEPKYRADFTREEYQYQPKIEFGRGVYIARLLLMVSTNSIRLEDHVMVSERVFIGDNNHSFSHPDVPIIYQPNTKGRPIVIGRGSWIGAGAALLGGTELGRNCVVGANSVCADMSCPSHSVLGTERAKVLFRRHVPEDAPQDE